MEIDLISVIIPTFNRKNTLMQSLNSVLNQTYKNIEVIIVDDCSTDNTENLFENFKDYRVKYVKYSPNQGACFARNYGIMLANGKYIAFQDSDDEWFKNKLEEEYIYLKQTNADLVFCGMNRYNSITNEKKFYPDVTFDNNKNALDQLLANNMISTQTILVKKEVLDKIKFDVSLKRYQDWDFVLQVAANNYQIKFLQKALVNSFIQLNSISATVNAGESYERLFEKYIKFYEKNPTSCASIYIKMANAYKKINSKKTKKYLKKSLHCKFNIKIFIKLIFYYTKLWK